MNIVYPTFSDVKSGFSSLVSGLGLIPVIIIGLVILAFVFFGIGGISNWWDSYKANKQVQSLQEEATQYKAQAEQEKAAKDQAIGLAAGYKAQAEELNTTLTELKNEKPALQQRINESERKVENIRNQRILPIDNNIRQRVDSLGAELDKLYPNT